MILGMLLYVHPVVFFLNHSCPIYLLIIHSSHMWTKVCAADWGYSDEPKIGEQKAALVKLTVLSR